MEANHLKLLAIDDNQDNLTTLRAVVRDALPRCVLWTALNGTRGIELARREDPDVILLDIVMPGMDGFEVCRRLKADERLDSIPVVFLTALRTDRDNRIKALEAGAEAFLSKPLDEQELIALVRAMAKLKAAHRLQQLEKEQLAALVAQRTQELERELAEHKRMEEALRGSEQRFRGIIENVSDIIFELTIEGSFRYVSPNWPDLMGEPAAAAIGKSFEAYVHPDDLHLCREALERVLHTEVKAASAEYRLLHRDGLTRWHFSRGSLLRDGAGTAVGYLAIARDVTERKQAEEDLRAANTRLEQAAARAAKLAERAEAANRAKSEFLANMSHEIRTPMTAILGHTEILNSGELSPTEQRESLRTIHRSGEALLGIINDILDLSRIEADRLPLHKSDCPLRQILDEVLAVAKIEAAKKGLSLQVAHRLPVPATIYTDPARLRQILVNLVGNAVKFTERGDVSLTVCCDDSGVGTARVQFIVADTGIGIPADKLEEIFQPFQQVDGSHTRRYGGTGLGLSICQRLAQALDGCIEVSSQLGQGSSFTLTIDGGPWRKVPGQGTSLQAAPGPLPRAEPGGAPSLVLQGRVLLVEDEPSLQVVICHMLRRLKLEVELAGDGQLACQLAEQSQSEGRPYALILMDLQLPKLDGLAATRWLRAQSWSGPIVALTAYAMVGDRERCLAAGCDDYLSKPISPSGLRDVLRRYLESPAV